LRHLGMFTRRDPDCLVRQPGCISHNVATLTTFDWKVEDRQLLLLRPPWFGVYQERVLLPDGRRIGDFYAIEITEFAVVVAFDHEGRVLLLRHYRHGARQTTWSLPSGYLDPGENALTAAKRELLEETGCEATSWEQLGRFVVDGNRGCGWADLFLAGGVVQRAQPHSGDLAEIEICFMPFEEAMNRLSSGEVAELATAAALSMASTRRQAHKNQHTSISEPKKGA